MIVIPYSTEAVIRRWPLGNIAIIVACVAMYVGIEADAIPIALLNAMVLEGWNPMGLLGYQFLHAGFGHLFFNMLFLWVFGNAVCETMGSLRYCALFLATGVLAGVIHNLFDGLPAVGASGALNGIMGVYLVLYPINKVDCFYWVYIRAGTFQITPGTGSSFSGCWEMPGAPTQVATRASPTGRISAGSLPEFPWGRSLRPRDGRRWRSTTTRA